MTETVFSDKLKVIAYILYKIKKQLSLRITFLVRLMFKQV